MSPSESADLLSSIQWTSTTHCTAMCTRVPNAWISLAANLEDHLAASLQAQSKCVIILSNTKWTASITDWTDDRAQKKALQDRQSGTGCVYWERTLRGNDDWRTNCLKRKIHIRVEVANNQSSMLERLNALQEDVDACSPSKSKSTSTI